MMQPRPKARCQAGLTLQAGLRVAQGGAAWNAADDVAIVWAKVTKSLADYDKGGMDLGNSVVGTLTFALSSAASAFSQFVTTDKFYVKLLVSSILAYLAAPAFRNPVLGPIASALLGDFCGNVFGRSGSASSCLGQNSQIYQIVKYCLEVSLECILESSYLRPTHYAPTPSEQGLP